jgi:hypothetical protein
MRDAVLAGPTTAEIVALVRLADDEIDPPPHVASSLRAKGWIISTPDGTALMTIAGRTLVDRCQSVDLDQLAGLPPHLASWGTSPNL